MISLLCAESINAQWYKAEWLLLWAEDGENGNVMLQSSVSPKDLYVRSLVAILQYHGEVWRLRRR